MKSGQSSVSVSYSPPSPHTFIPYNLPQECQNQQCWYEVVLKQRKNTTRKKKKIKTYSFNLCRWVVKNAISLPKCFAGSKPMAATCGISYPSHLSQQFINVNLERCSLHTFTVIAKIPFDIWLDRKQDYPTGKEIQILIDYHSY